MDIYLFVCVCVCVCVCVQVGACVCACVYCIYISAVKRLIAINHIQNKRFCLHNICVYTVCTVYIYEYINTHSYSIYFEKMYYI